MIVVMEPGASEEVIDQVIRRLREFGFDVHLSRGVERTVIGAIGEKTAEKIQQLEATPGVEKIVPILQPYKLAGKEFKSERSQIEVNGVVFGGTRVPVIAGPCAVESREQLLETARRVKEAGAALLRGGAYKPRTSPYSFQGLAEEGLKILAEAREETGLGIVTEVVNPRDVETVGRYADMFQIGARNMQNFSLLTEVGKTRVPVLLKRGLSATINEWLMAAEYIISAGNPNVILCERGIRTFETETRNTLDLSAVVAVHELSHLPVVVDPSHGTGKWKYVTDMAKAAVAAGADGLIVEVHPRPEEALSDGPQSLRPEVFQRMMESVDTVARAVGRYVLE
ncbi:MAG TPA: 3-deoxy-7-phosphoheptulonate synthase [Limnochordia bacterium]|nr:3-deoxy-7-phosphoheptulonate synthase [Limnochordia bacterium]